MSSASNTQTAIVRCARSYLGRGFRYGKLLLGVEDASAPAVEPEPAIEPEVVKRGYDRMKWAEPISVEVAVTPDVTRRLLESTALVWSKLGETDAHWSVITRDDFRRAVFGEQAEAAFYETGRHDYISLSRTFERAGENLEDVETVFELGCGTGRVTEAFAARKRRVLAVDVSASHLALAAERMEKIGAKNVELMRMERIEDFEIKDSFDLVYSVIVLQHNPPPVAYEIILKLLNLVKIGGYIFFQIPTYIFGYIFNEKEYHPQLEQMEMHCIPMTLILRLLSKHGFDLLEVLEDDRHGSDNIVSHTFLAQRR